MEFLLENIFGIFWAALILLMSFWAVCSIISSRYNEPASALLWLLLIVFAPGVGVGLYLVFGVRVSAHRDNGIDCQDSSPGGTEGTQTLQTPLLETLNKLFPEDNSKNNAMKLLEDGTKAYPEMLFAIDHAVKTIELQSFIIVADPVGTLFLQKLEERAAAGVQVHLVYDSFGSFKAVCRRFFRRKVENLKIRAYSPLSIFTPWRLQYRNHRKLLIVDNVIAFMGGINISDANSTQYDAPAPLAGKDKLPRRKAIHDLHCLIVGDAVHRLRHSFFRDWDACLKDNPRRADYLTWSENCEKADPALLDFYQKRYKIKPSNELRIIRSGPAEHYGASQNMFWSAAINAKKSIWIQTPYFVPGSDFIQLLGLAAARGVDVRVIVPANNNHFFVKRASRSFYRMLMNYGVKVYERQGVFSHIKAMLVDEEYVFMGSSNCDMRSFKLNYELDICVSPGDFVNMVKPKFDLKREHCVLVKCCQLPKDKITVFIDNIFSLLAPIL